MFDLIPIPILILIVLAVLVVFAGIKIVPQG